MMNLIICDYETGKPIESLHSTWEMMRFSFLEIPIFGSKFIIDGIFYTVEGVSCDYDKVYLQKAS